MVMALIVTKVSDSQGMGVYLEFRRTVCDRGWRWKDVEGESGEGT